jgi:putative ABC transport system ATP-binding protein
MSAGGGEPRPDAIPSQGSPWARGAEEPDVTSPYARGAADPDFAADSDFGAGFASRTAGASGARSAGDAASARSAGDAASARSAGDAAGDPSVVCRDVIRSYRISADDTVHALKGVDLVLYPGTVTALIGPSGSGKSTLLRLLACVDRPDSGSILIQGRDTARLSRARRVKLRRRSLGYMFQSPADNLLGYLTVRQHLRLAAQMRGVSVRNREADDLLERLGLGGRAHNLPRQLSGGEQQRAAIAFAAVGPPALLVADEPTGQLDHDTVGDVLEAFTALARTGVAIVAATHDPVVARHADRVVHMVDGRIEEER